MVFVFYVNFSAQPRGEIVMPMKVEIEEDSPNPEPSPATTAVSQQQQSVVSTVSPLPGSSSTAVVEQQLQDSAGVTMAADEADVLRLLEEEEEA